MKIESGSAISLRAVILRDLKALEELGQRFPAMDHPWTFVETSATGYLLHNIYNALENLFEQISLTFENHVVDDSRWHAELLGKMFLDMEGLRPRLFSGVVKPFLNDLRGLWRGAGC